MQTTQCQHMTHTQKMSNVEKNIIFEKSATNPKCCNILSFCQQFKPSSKALRKYTGKCPQEPPKSSGTNVALVQCALPTYVGTHTSIMHNVHNGAERIIKEKMASKTIVENVHKINTPIQIFAI